MGQCCAAAAYGENICGRFGADEGYGENVCCGRFGADAEYGLVLLYGVGMGNEYGEAYGLDVAAYRLGYAAVYGLW